MPENPEISVKKFYFLVAGEILFKTNDDQTGAIRLNALIDSTTKNLPLHKIGKAQQSLQIQFFEKANDPNIQVLDVVVSNISCLGLMTEAEFRAAPEGMTLQPVDPNNPFENKLG